MPEASGKAATLAKRIGLIAGPVAALLCYLSLPDTYAGTDGREVILSHAARAALAMMVWMALWWMTEAVPIEATALLPVVAFPLLGVATLAKTTSAYGSDIVFLFLGGFILAAAIQRWGLDRRIAFLTLRVVGTKPDRIVGGLMGATAFLSMWVSNTATAAMMVPIAQSVIVLYRIPQAQGSASSDADERAHRNFALAILLSIAYAASIGGIGTIVGSPPNGIAVRFIEQTYGHDVSFVQWIAIALPVVIVFLPLAWLMLTKVLFRTDLPASEHGRDWVVRQWRALGPLNRGERITLVVFSFTVAFWITRPLLTQWTVGGITPFAGLSDAGIAVAAALVLFLVPVDRKAGSFAMDWRTAQTLPWGVLILFGGGLALAGAIEATGVAGFIGSQARTLGGWPVWAVLLVVVAATIFLSEVTSNTAQVATMIPLLAAMAAGLGVDPLLLIVSCTLAASCAFMLPVGTPPNAIVFGTGLVTIPQMCKAGFWLNLIGIALITLLSALFLPFVLGRVTI
jgi:solute carrier family 13 (sodium-dependent dicarboxylate transporter), member 2/3/5